MNGDCVEQNGRVSPPCAEAMADKTEAEAPPRRGGLQRILDNGNRSGCPDLEIGASPTIRTGISGASVQGNRGCEPLLRREGQTVRLEPLVPLSPLSYTLRASYDATPSRCAPHLDSAKRTRIV
jgi:hypothetical protein